MERSGTPDCGFGGSYFDVVGAEFDVALSVTSTVACDVVSAWLCPRSTRWIWPRFAGMTASEPRSIWITDNDTDRLGVSDPGDRAGSGGRGAPRGRSRPVPCLHS